MNSVNLVGNLTSDPELKFTSGKGTAVAKCTLAVRRDSENTDFINCTVWGKSAETLANYCVKGSKIGLEGSIKTGSYEKDGRKVYTTEVHSMRIHLLSSKPKTQEEVQGEVFNNEGFEEVVNTDDIPF